MTDKIDDDDDFPYKRLYGNMENVICERFMRLCSWIAPFVITQYHINNAPELTRAQLRFSFPREYSHTDSPLRNRLSIPNFVIMALKSGDYEKLNLISDFFIEHLRIRAYRSDDPQHQSVADYWRANRDRIRANTGNILEHMRENIYHHKIEVGTFRPTVATGIVQLLRYQFGTNCNTILNPCAGWGDRLIGIAAAGHITGGLVDVDPNRELCVIYPQILNWTEKCTGKHEIANYKCICSPFEDIAPDTLRAIIREWSVSDDGFDLVMCDPPYFDLEIYDPNDPTQSTARYKTFDEWYDKFLLTTAQNSCAVLRKGGVFALIINQQYKGRKFLQKMVNDITATTRANMRYLGVISYAEINNSSIPPRSPQPIWLWLRIV